MTSSPSPNTTGFSVMPGLLPQHRAAAARAYWQAFSRKLRYPLGPEDKAQRFITGVLNPDYAISALSSEGDFLGAAGFKTAEGAFVGGGLSDLMRAYGRLGGLGRALLVSLLERKPQPGTLLMDGIFVEPQARGLGVGTALLDALEAQAARLGAKALRLDVIDTNPRARALYARRGFVETGRVRLGPLASIFGFSSASTMVKQVGSIPEGAAQHS